MDHGIIRARRRRRTVQFFDAQIKKNLPPKYIKIWLYRRVSDVTSSRRGGPG